MSSVDQIRRCEILFFEPREVVRFVLEGLLAGGNGLQRDQHWVALAPPLAEPVTVNAAERELLGSLSPAEWKEHALADPLLRGLVERGLVITRQCTEANLAEHRQRDEAIRQSYWHPLNAVMHAFTRWEGVDAVKNTEDAGVGTAIGMLDVLGPPPNHALAEQEAAIIELPVPERTALDDLLARRATCRNFDSARPLPLAMFTQVLHRTFGAQQWLKSAMSFHSKSATVPPVEACTRATRIYWCRTWKASRRACTVTQGAGTSWCSWPRLRVICMRSPCSV